MTDRYRPLVQSGAVRAPGAVPLAGGPLWFTHAERLTRDGAGRAVVPARDIPAEGLDRFCAPRAAIAGLDMTRPQIMGIVNTTPDSFSDGGRHLVPEAAIAAARAMIGAGATILDIGGESTRPGAQTVAEDEEIARTAPVIAAIRADAGIAISIDTRKAAVTAAAVEAGADLVNDVSGFTFDPALAPLCAKHDVPVCVMHMQGDPQTMQDNPTYEDVVLDVYDHLDRQVQGLERAGIDRSLIVVDPGIGFGKTQDHNLALLQNLSVFHGLGCAVLLGVSRKGFIGRIGKEPRADARFPGSLALGLAGLAQGVQILRVHDVAETAQALRLWMAVR